MIELNSYFNPLNPELYDSKDSWSITQVGRLIDFHTEGSFPEVKFAEIAIFNVPEYEGSKNRSISNDCKIRASFYQLHQDKMPRVVDLGTLKLMPTRKESFKLIQDVCRNLLHDGVIPIIIGGGHDISYAVYKAYASWKNTLP